jgi:hypothetical protein
MIELRALLEDDVRVCWRYTSAPFSFITSLCSVQAWPARAHVERL